MLTTQGQAPARVIRRAQVLLRASEGLADHEVAAALQVHPTTVQRLRRRCAQGGLDAALYDRPRPGAAPKLDARGEAFLVALACSDPPEGRESWTMQLLADRLVVAGVVEEISDETVRRRLGKKPAQALAG
jgi:transposase